MRKINFKGVIVKKETVADIVRITLISLIISIILVLLLALIVKLTNIGTNIILPINQVIKIISILSGTFLGTKLAEKGALKGAVAGLLFTLISMFLFAAVEGGEIIALATLVDILAGTVIGLVSGIIVVNVKN